MLDMSNTGQDTCCLSELLKKKCSSLPKAVQHPLVRLVRYASVIQRGKGGAGRGFLALLPQGGFGAEVSACTEKVGNYINFFLFIILCGRFPQLLSTLSLYCCQEDFAIAVMRRKMLSSSSFPLFRHLMVLQGWLGWGYYSK